MRPTSRGLVLAAAVLAALLLAWRLYVAFEPHREARRLQQARFAFLTLGMSRAAVRSKAGTPDQTCRGGEAVRLLEGQLPDPRGRGASEAETLRHLESRTAEVLVYNFPEPSPERSRISCGPAYLDTAVGLDSSGSVLWFTVLRGEDIVRYALARPPDGPQ